MTDAGLIVVNFYVQIHGISGQTNLYIPVFRKPETFIDNILLDKLLS